MDVPLPCPDHTTLSRRHPTVALRQQVDRASEGPISLRLVLDSRVVDVSMVSNPTVVFLSSLRPLFFNNPENEFRFSDNTGVTGCKFW